MNSSGGYVDTEAVVIQTFFSYVIFFAIVFWVSHKIVNKILNKKRKNNEKNKPSPRGMPPRPVFDYADPYLKGRQEPVVAKKDSRIRPEYINHINKQHRTTKVLDIVTPSTQEMGIPKYKYRRKKFLMSNAERKFFESLVVAVGRDYVVFPQVNLDKFLSHKVVGQSFRGALSTIQRKSVDFLVCSHTYYVPLVAIELDDSTHSQPDRAERDKLVNEICRQAGMPLLRVRWSKDYSPSHLRALVDAKISKGHSSFR